MVVGLWLVVAGCGPVHPLAATSTPPRVIPWLSLPADLTPLPVSSPQPLPVPAGTPPCTGAELLAVDVGSQGATGNVVTSIDFAATTSGGCYLEGTPSVTLLDRAGADLGFKNRAPYFPNDATGPAYVAQGPPPEPHTELKSGQASLTVDWVSQPEACVGEAGVSIAAVRIAMPAGELTVPLTERAPEGYACQGVGVGSFQSTSVPVEMPATPALPAIALVVQSGAYPGKRFEYLVTLTNSTKQPMNLAAHCPNYEEELFADIEHGSPPLGGKHLYMLNCHPAGTLAPGASVIFQMLFDVPAGATPGTYTLMFGMGYSNETRTDVERPVVVLKG